VRRGGGEREVEGKREVEGRCEAEEGKREAEEGKREAEEGRQGRGGRSPRVKSARWGKGNSEWRKAERWRAGVRAKGYKRAVQGGKAASRRAGEGKQRAGTPANFKVALQHSGCN
jgi:hypothetical protein